MRFLGRLAALTAAVAVVPVAAATPAAAGTAGPVVVHADGGGRAVVTRDPFRLAVYDAAGRRVLQQARATSRGVTLPLTEDPEPFGLERKPDRAVYRPFGFLIGRERAEQWTGSYWAGNVLRRTREGVWHSARRVERVQPVGDGGVRLTVATTARGRRLLVTIRPAPGGLDVDARPEDPRGVVAMADSFTSTPAERFHGLGGRHWGTEQRGRVVPSWIEQENFGGAAYTSAFDLLAPLLAEGADGRTLASLGLPLGLPLPGGPDRAIFPGGPSAAYSVGTHLISSAGYGLTLDRPEYARWRLASDRPDACQLDVSSRRLQYRITPGAPRRVVARQTARTGRNLLPPAWAHGATLWRLYRVNGEETTASYQAAVEADLADIERLDVPLAAYAFESWSQLPTDVVRRTIRRLRARGIRTILYVRAHFAKDVLATQDPRLVDEVRAKGLAAKDARGRPATFGVPGLPDGAVLLDFTNPAAVTFWNRELRRMLDLGADGFMQDFGEATLDGMRFANGETGRTMHNRYPLLYHGTTRRFLERYEREHPERGRIFMFTRAGFTGSAGLENASFPGDETTNWSAATGLRSLAPDMLNRAVGGQFGFTTDIGGYADLLDGPPNDELFTRWSQVSALTPFFRVHNSANAGTRRPWDFTPLTYARWKALAALHDRATPLIRRLWSSGRRTGIPPTRPLWLSDPSVAASRADQQWLLGNDVLVAPVVKEGARSRSVRFPAGCWQRVGGASAGERVRGPVSRTVAAPLDELPYFFRCGRRPF